MLPEKAGTTLTHYFNNLFVAKQTSKLIIIYFKIKIRFNGVLGFWGFGVLGSPTLQQQRRLYLTSLYFPTFSPSPHVKDVH